MRLRKFSFTIFVCLVLADQATKYAAYGSHFGSFLNVLRPAFGKELFPNQNFAFSLHVPVVLMYLVYAVVVVGLVAWYVRTPSPKWQQTLAVELILAGALSNILDRVTFGYVRDFIYVFWGNIFDLADVFIVGGILLFLMVS
jgi:signal peptidase II